MNQLLQEAITATRSGNKKEAQLLLAKNLKENPEDVHSWYLLSMLVDSKEKQAVYLGKTLALDPTHEKAQTRLTALVTAPAVAISEEPLDFLGQAEGDTLPEWLAGDADALQLEMVGARIEPTAVETARAVGTAGKTEEVGETAVPLDSAVPEWLREGSSQTWAAPEAPTQISASPAVQTKPAAKAKAAPPKPAPRRKPARKRQRARPQKFSQSNLVLAILIMAMVLVTLALLYVAR